MTFFSIPIRTNGTLSVAASWFNTLRTAGLSMMGASGTLQTEFAILNTQVNSDITDLLFVQATSLSATIEYHINGASFQKSSFDVYFDGATWRLTEKVQTALNGGVTFSITAAGQVQYTSGGASVGQCVLLLLLAGHILRQLKPMPLYVYLRYGY